MNITMSLSHNITIKNPNKNNYIMKMEKLLKKKIYFLTKNFKR